MFTKLEKELLYKLLGLIVSAICEHSEIFNERTRVIIVSALNRLLKAKEANHDIQISS